MRSTACDALTCIQPLPLLWLAQPSPSLTWPQRRHLAPPHTHSGSFFPADLVSGSGQTRNKNPLLRLHPCFKNRNGFSIRTPRGLESAPHSNPAPPTDTASIPGVWHCWLRCRLSCGKAPRPRGPQLFPSEPAVPATAHDSPPPRTTHCVKEGLAHAHPAM